MLGRLFRLVIIGWFVGMIAAAFAALSLKRRLSPTLDESADEITAVAIFGPLAFHSTSQAFRGGEVECWYGGGVIDLRDAQLAPEGATLRVRAIFGGGQIVVPPTWKVASRVTGLGGIQDIRAAQGHAAIDPELLIEGTLVAGGFAVSSEVAEEEQEWLSAVKEQQADAAADAREAAANFETTAESAGIEATEATKAKTGATEASTATEAADSSGDTSEEMAPAT
jgi:hypothetical protein